MKLDDVRESSAALDAMAELAATTYYDLAIKFGLTKYPRLGVRKSRNWSKFMRVARICYLHGVPVDKFVTMALTQAMERHSIVTVQDILSFDYKLALAPPSENASGPSPQDLWNLLSCKLLDTVFSLDSAGDRTDILDDTLYGFPAWFRVFSPHDPVQKLIVHWGDLASEELSSDMRLDAFLLKKRPLTHRLLKSVMKNIKQP